MNQDQINGMLRILVPAICSWLASQGISVLDDSNVVSGIIAALIAVGAVAWSIFVHTNSAKIASVSEIDRSIKIEVPNKLAVSDEKIYKMVVNPAINVTTLPTHIGDK